MMAPLVAAVFAAAGGWHIGAGQVRGCQGVPASRCIQVASWAKREGIRIQLTVAREHPPVAPPGRWPVRIEPGDVGGLEGVPPNVGVYQRLLRIGRDEAYVFVYFSRADPTRKQLAAANAELATTSVR